MENQPPAEHIEWADYVSIETTCASDLFSRSLESLHRSYGWRSLSNVRGHSSPSKIIDFRGPRKELLLQRNLKHIKFFRDADTF